MLKFKPIDNETNIEEYEGYVGMIWDGELYMSPELSNFNQFDWHLYLNLAQEFDEIRKIKYEFRNEKYQIEFNLNEDLALLIDEFKSVEVHFDDGGEYGAMGSGSGYIFFLRSGYTLEDAKTEFQSVLSALNQDFDDLKNS